VLRSNILLSAPLPTIGQAYSLVIQDEKQREIHAAPAYPGDSASFLVGNVGERRNNEYKSNQGNYAKKSSLVCNYCKKTGHTIDQCYKIHGSLLILSLLNLRGTKRDLLLEMCLAQGKHHNKEILIMQP